MNCRHGTIGNDPGVRPGQQSHGECFGVEEAVVLAEAGLEYVATNVREATPQLRLVDELDVGESPAMLQAYHSALVLCHPALRREPHVASLADIKIVLRLTGDLNE